MSGSRGLVRGAIVGLDSEKYVVCEHHKVRVRLRRKEEGREVTRAKL